MPGAPARGAATGRLRKARKGPWPARPPRRTRCAPWNASTTGRCRFRLPVGINPPHTSAPMERTSLRDARTHNLKGIDLDLDPGQMIVVAGVSGAGKSSLALDTLYAEGQRRFVESFSAYARQFLERRDRPPVGRLDPVPAAIAVDRGAPVRTSRSTVGTMTELQD